MAFKIYVLRRFFISNSIKRLETSVTRISIRENIFQIFMFRLLKLILEGKNSKNLITPNFQFLYTQLVDSNYAKS